MLYVANVDEGEDDVPSVVADHAAAVGAAAVAVSSRIEAELSELDDEEAAVMREELGVGETGLDRVVRGAFGLLDLLAFLHRGRGQAGAELAPAARAVRAWHAAGQIHSDIQRGFVRAEVIGWEALVDAGGYARARERGTLRLEGRDDAMGRRRRHHGEVHAVASPAVALRCAVPGAAAPPVSPGRRLAPAAPQAGSFPSRGRRLRPGRGRWRGRADAGRPSRDAASRCP